MGNEKNCPDQIRRFDWIALINGYWLDNNDWLADINWPDHLTCSSYSVRRKTPWEDLANKGSNFTHSITSPYGRQWVKMCHIFWEQVMINLAAFICDWVRISFKTFEMSPYFNNHLILCFFKVSNFLWRLSTHMLDTKILSPHFP